MLSVLLIYNKSSSSFPAYIWMLARDGMVAVDVLASKGHVVGVSRWKREAYEYASEQEFSILLKERAQQGNYAAILCIDESSRNLFFEHCDEGWLQAYLPFPKGSPLFAACGDKVLFQQWCESHSIPAPKADYAKNESGVLEAAESIGYPLILKGAVGSRGVEVHRAENAEEVKEFIARSPHQQSWLVQEFIAGPVGSTSIVCKEGKLYGVCSSYKYMSLSGGMGPSSIRRFLDDPELIRIAERVASVGQVSGITGYDWMEVSPGQYRVIDPHLGRGPSSVLVSHYNGVDMGRAFYASLTDGPPEPLPDGDERIVWVMPQMIRIFFEGGFRWALKHANPMRRDISIFWCGKGEWRVLLKLVVPYVFGQLRVKAGRVLRYLKGSRN